MYLFIYPNRISSWYTTSKGVTVRHLNGEKHFYPYSVLKSFTVVLNEED